MTFKQAKEEGLNILKGSGSFPVFFWKLYIRGNFLQKVSPPPPQFLYAPPHLL
ncbi:ArdC-like ssDNA-binding domain-containing protein [Bilophila wadsworthia]|uniref:ArdC-like ssDNA-binding domain-containing protein n=1 Tax=Bilophila wadsworthia TaxID=35833 RepID=UPI003AB3F532